MNTRMNPLILLLMALTLALSGCAAPAAQPAPTLPPATAIPPTQPPPTPLPLSANPAAKVVLAMVQHLNDGDVEGSLAYFAEDAAIYFIGMPTTGMEMYRGKEGLRPVWTDSAAGHFKWEVEITSASGGVVQAKTQTWHDVTRQLGVAPNAFTDVYVVKDGKISTYASTLSEASLAKFKPALAAAMPEAFAAAGAPAGEPVSALTVTLAGGTCTAGSPPALKAGQIKLTWEVKDSDRQAYGLTLFTLSEGKDLMDLMAASTRPYPPEWSKMIFYEEQGPATRQTYTVKVDGGPVYAVCWSKPPDLPVGNFGPLEVKP